MNRFLLIGAAALCALAIMPTLPAAAMPMSPRVPTTAQAGGDTIPAGDHAREKIELQRSSA